MAFICSAKQPPQAGVLVTSSPSGRWDAIFQIGYDPTWSLTYYMGVHTYLRPTGETEFGFCLVIVDNVSGQEAYTYASSITRQIIPGTDRESISFLLKFYVRELLQASSPKEFLMETFEPNLPPQALHKYAILNHIFQSLGYSVTTMPTTNGKALWVLKL